MRRPALIVATILAALVVALQNASAFSTVVVDAGHGGHDRGGVPGQRVSEKDLSLDTARRVEQLLKKAGYRVVMTRTRDTFVPLPTRCAIANTQRDAIFVSVHYNSSSNRGASGFETYYYSSSGARIASNIQHNLVRYCRSDNRGVKRRRFHVLRDTRIPSVLVECGFLTNPTEARRCLSSDYRQRLAEQIVRGIIASDSTPGRRAPAGSPTTTRYASTAAPAPPPAPAKRTASAATTRRSSPATSSSGTLYAPEVVATAPPGGLARYNQTQLKELFLESRIK